MKTVTLDVRSPSDAMGDFTRAWNSGKAQKARISFATPGRDVQAVHADLTALLAAGVLGRADSGGIEFPFEVVKVGFLLRAA